MFLHFLLANAVWFLCVLSVRLMIIFIIFMVGLVKVMISYCSINGWINVIMIRMFVKVVII